MPGPTRQFSPLSIGRVVLGYVLAAVAWILLSYQLASMLSPSADSQTTIDAVIGLGFVAITGLLLAALLHRYERARARQVAEIAERERKFRLLADNARDIIFRYRIEPSRGFEYVSPSVEAALGYRAEMLYSDPAFVDGLVHPDDPAIFPVEPDAVPASDLVQGRLRAADGRWVPLEVHLARPPDDTPGVVTVEGVARDVSHRERTESELRRLNRVLRTMSAANRALVRAEHEPELLSTICRTIVDEGGFRLAWVGYPDPDGTVVRPVAHAGHAAGYLDAMVVDLRDVPAGRGPIGTSIREARTVVSGDIATDPTMAPRRAEALQRGYASVAAFPLLGRAGVLGTLAIYAAEQDAFGAQEVALLEELNADLTYGVEALRERLAHEAGEAERLRLAAAVTQSTESVVISDPTGAIEYVNPAFERLTGYRRDEVLGQNPRILKSGQHPPAFYDTMWATLTAGGTWVGDIVNRRRDGSLFTEETVISPVLDAGGALAGYVAVKHDVTSQRVAEALARTRAREHTLIADALAALRPLDTPEQTARLFCQQLIRLPEASVAVLLTFDFDGRASTLASVAANGRPLEPHRFAEAGAHQLLARAREGPWVDGWVARRGHPFDQAFATLGIRGLAFAPIVVEGDVVGLLELGSAHPAAATRLTERLSALADFAAIAAAVLGPTFSRRAQVEHTRSHIRLIIERRSFQPVFQPIVDLQSGEVIGHEALTRFTDGLPPDQHFGNASGLGLGTELEIATLELALEAAAALPQAAYLNVNVSPATILAGEPLASIARQHGRPLVLEITEHEAVSDYAGLRAAVAALGPDVKIAVDDAGAGFSSMRHILELRPDFVKIDRSLVAEIERDPARQAFLGGLRHFADSVDCRLVAEGIETEAELATLRLLGMHTGQGDLLGRPVPVAELTDQTRRQSEASMAARGMTADLDRPDGGD
jgi:PAS domain S-box-containing protein